MARKLIKRDWNQPKGGYSPFAKSSPKASVKQVALCDTCGGARTYEAYDRVQRAWFTYRCPSC